MSNQRAVELPNPLEYRDQRTEAMVRAFLALVEALSPEEREILLRQVTEKLRPISVPKAGEVLGVIVQLIPRDREWSLKEIRNRVGRISPLFSDKEIYNAIGYLTRKQHINRVGHGRYIINGIAVVTGDDLGGQPSIVEGEPDN